MAAWIDFEKIKREADFATVLRHYGFEFPDGRTQLKLPCPFHEESRPSLSVNLEGKVFHCFGCGARGNVLEFVQRMARQAGKPLGTRQAMLRLAEICGIREIETDRPRSGAGNGPRRRVHARLGAETGERPSEPATLVPEAPARPQGHAEEPEEVNPPLSFTLKLDPAHPYLAERGLSAATIEAFGLGYCVRGLMKGRVCIPIHDDAGELVAYAGRWAGPDETIPEGKDRYELPPRFEKSRVLFNLHRVVSEHVVLVGGFFGAFRLHALGYPVVALMGHVLSEHHVELLERAGVRRLTLLLDGDEPGRAAAAKILGRLADASFLALAAGLPAGVQPDTANEVVLCELLRLTGIRPQAREP